MGNLEEFTEVLNSKAPPLLPVGDACVSLPNSSRLGSKLDVLTSELIA